jgi:predicted TIM-barrel fold metal-dependent hydrolase
LSARAVALSLALCVGLGCAHPAEPAPAASGPTLDPELAAYIDTIRAVDDHTHVNSTVAGDRDYDALPIEVLVPLDLPARLRPDHPDWVAAYRALYRDRVDVQATDLGILSAASLETFRTLGPQFPEWVLDRIGTQVMLANRVAMGQGLAPPRFRWVSYVDALLLPVSTRDEAAVTPDRQKLYPYEETLLARYLADLSLAKLPATLDGYLGTVVTPTLERQHQAGCVAVKFEAAYLRSLAFDDATREAAARVYARYVHGGAPTHAEYKTLEDYLFRAIAGEAGRLGMAVHVHSFEGAGSFYRVADSDPLLLEPALNDPALRRTQFVILHGGGMYAPHAGALLAKPNVHLDISGLVLVDPPSVLAPVLRGWLAQFPEKVLFGTDAAAFGPGIGWDVAAQLGTSTARSALAIALSEMMRDGEVTRARAERLAAMVMRTNAARLYHLSLS